MYSFQGLEGLLFSLWRTEHCGRNSAVECHLPKVDVVGSSPIARSIFYLFFCFCSFLPCFSNAQVTADPTLPFEQGQVVLLPATTAYLGDMPHFIDLVPADEPFHSLGGAQAPLVGWVDPIGQSSVGLRAVDPGFFFENIPYPLASSSLNLLPAVGTAQILNFPAQAWLGPAAASGGVNLTAPEAVDNPQNHLSGWGGTGSTLGADDRFQSSILNAELDYRHGSPAVTGSTDTLNFISKENWFQTNGLELGSGFLGTQGLGNDHWYSSYLNVDLLSPNFQTLQFKPYFQSAQSGSQTVQDAGFFLNYLFNLAGLAETHFGCGLDSENGTNILAANRGFIQSTSLIDVLGDIALDAAFRFDLSNVDNTTFSTVLGLQGRLDTWTFLGDYDKGVLPLIDLDVQQTDVGVRFQPDDNWNATAKYIYEQLGTVGYNGGDLRLQMNRFQGFWFVKTVEFDAEERILTGTGNLTQYDTGLTCSWSLFYQDHWWVTGRCVSNEPPLLEAGLNYAVSKEIKVFGAFENISGILMAVPDGDMPNGVVASFGVQYSAN